MATDEWQSIADEFLDYLGALSFETPDLDTSEAKAALKDASEAAAGAVAYAAYHPHCSFQVFLEYVNFGMSYDPGEDAPEESVLPGERRALPVGPQRQSQVARRGLPLRPEEVRRAGAGNARRRARHRTMAVVLDDTGDDEEYPPSAQAKLGSERGARAGRVAAGAARRVGGEHRAGAVVRGWRAGAQCAGAPG
jgi:hypothetical protein